jgi:hypothetical protein
MVQLDPEAMLLKAMQVKLLIWMCSRTDLGGTYGFMKLFHDVVGVFDVEVRMFERPFQNI